MPISRRGDPYHHVRGPIEAIDRPITAGSPPNRPRHMASLSTTMGGRLGKVSSGTKTRPTAARTPTVRKNFCRHPGLTPCLVRREPGSHELIGLELEVQSHLVVHVALESTAHDERAEPAPGASDPAITGDLAAQAPSRTCSIASANRRQLSCSVTTCFRPMAVSL